jgi:O-acetyl-ADP-ribose deacetylase (regulator of RNase III)
MKLILVDLQAGFITAAQHFFADLPGVSTFVGSFTDITAYDCMVSPANSFGLMDGGIDAAIIRYFGYPLMSRVQQYILDEYLGEQPVGTSFIVETGNPQHPYLAHTPTMRVPMSISRTDNVYKAMFALLLAVRKHNAVSARPIETVVCPGLGTGTGRVPFRMAAYQMALAYRHFDNPPARLDWHVADARHQAIKYGGDDGCRFPPEWV